MMPGLIKQQKEHAKEIADLKETHSHIISSMHEHITQLQHELRVYSAVDDFLDDLDFLRNLRIKDKNNEN